VSGWKIVHAIHGNGYTAFLNRRRDGMVTAWTAGNDRADEDAEESGQRIVRHDDGTCTIEDLPRSKTALQLIDELRVVLRGMTLIGDPATSRYLTAIAEAIREGRAS
jgi:hypothetical protein